MNHNMLWFIVGGMVTKIGNKNPLTLSWQGVFTISSLAVTYFGYGR